MYTLQNVLGNHIISWLKLMFSLYAFSHSNVIKKVGIYGWVFFLTNDAYCLIRSLSRDIQSQGVFGVVTIYPTIIDFIMTLDHSQK